MRIQIKLSFFQVREFSVILKISGLAVEGIVFSLIRSANAAAPPVFAFGKGAGPQTVSVRNMSVLLQSQRGFGLL